MKIIQCHKCNNEMEVYHLDFDSIICTECKSEIKNTFKKKRKEQKFITTNKCTSFKDVNYYLYQHHNAIIDLIKINSNLFKEINDLKTKIK